MEFSGSTKYPVVGGMTFADISIRVESPKSQLASKPACRHAGALEAIFLPKNGRGL